MTFSHHRTCDDANFLTNLSSSFFSNSCHFLKAAVHHRQLFDVDGGVLAANPEWAVERI
jgi:hypothetical protein